MSVKKVLTLATEEFVVDLVNKLKEDFPITLFNQLNTNDKTIPGAINEVNDLLNLFVEAEYDVTAKMYYGVIDPAEVGGITSFKDITAEMFNSENVIETKPGERNRVTMGVVEAGKIIFIALPTIYDLVASKDDGFGGKMPFDDTVLGANGIDVMIDGQGYMLFGEFTIVTGERKINITKRVPIVSGCECPPITDDDITNIIGSLNDE